MKDLEKYIFDPDNLRDFKVKNLLLKIVKDNNNAVFIDPYFFIEIFQKEIFSGELLEQMWDKPENFDQLSGNEKMQVYVDQFSEVEFREALKKQVPAISRHYINQLFAKFIYASDISSGYSQFKQWDTIFNHHVESLFVKNNALKVERRSAYNNNLILFVNGEYNNIIEKFKSHYSSLVITTIENFEKISNFPDKFHPLLLKKTSDVHLLLDLIRRDVNIEKTKRPATVTTASNQEITYLDKFEIKKYFSIDYIRLTKLADKKEVYFLGENGDGKTILLQAILLALKNNNVVGTVTDFIDRNPTKEKLKITAHDDKKKEYVFRDGRSRDAESYENIFAYGINRFRNDSDRKEEEGYLSLFNHDQYLENPVKWLQKIDYQEKDSSETPQISLLTAKEILRDLLDKNVEIEVSSSGVIFNERGTIVEFNQLSDGYKSVIIWICDLLSRLVEKQPHIKNIQDYRGIVLVDEIGVYLHPKWQYSIVNKLRDKFPNIQFIFTTHSPIIIMGASKDAAFYKVYKENGVTKISEPLESISNLMANGIITSPLFGLEDARPASFDENKEELDTSDDYLLGKIHEEISRRIQKRNNVTEEEIMRLVQKELDKLEK